jgi:hypothetical protein
MNILSIFIIFYNLVNLVLSDVEASNSTEVEEFSIKTNHFTEKEANKLKLSKFLKVHENMPYYEINNLYYLQLLIKTHKNLLILVYDSNTTLSIDVDNYYSNITHYSMLNHFDLDLEKELNPEGDNINLKNSNLTYDQKSDIYANVVYKHFKNELLKAKEYVEAVEYKQKHKTSMKFCLYRVNNTYKFEKHDLTDIEILHKHFNYTTIPFYMFIHNRENPMIYNTRLEDLSLSIWLELAIYPRFMTKLDIIKRNARVYKYYLVYLGDNVDMFMFLKELSIELNTFELDYCAEEECITELNAHFGGLAFFIEGKKYLFENNNEGRDTIINWILSNLIGLNKKIDKIIAHLLFKLNMNKVILVYNNTNLDFISNNDISKIDQNKENNQVLPHNPNNDIVRKLNNDKLLNIYENISRHFFGKILFFNMGITDETDKILIEYLNIDKSQGFPQIVYMGPNYHQFGGSKKYSIRNLLDSVKLIYIDEQNPNMTSNDLNNKYFDDEHINPLDNAVLTNNTLNALEETIYRLITANINMPDYPGLDFTQEYYSKYVIKDNSFLENSNINYLKSYSTNFVNLENFKNITYPFYHDNSDVILVNEMNADYIIEKVEGDIIMLEKWRSLKIFSKEIVDKLFIEELLREEDEFVKLFFYYYENKEKLESHYGVKVFFILQEHSHLKLKYTDEDESNHLSYIHKSRFDIVRNHKIVKVKFDRHLKSFEFENLKQFFVNILEEHKTNTELLTEHNSDL